MKISKTSLAICTVILGLAGAVATKAANFQQKVKLYYQIPGQQVSSTFTTLCPNGPKACKILVAGIAVPLYRDITLQDPVKSLTDSPKPQH